MAPLPFHQPGMYRLLFLLAKRARLPNGGGFCSSLQPRGERRAQRAVWDERSEQYGASAASRQAKRLTLAHLNHRVYNLLAKDCLF